jgi:hypothetical protein
VRVETGGGFLNPPLRLRGFASVAEALLNVKNIEVIYDHVILVL